MHGIIFQQLQNYTNSVFGAAEWSAILEEADLKGKTFLPTQVYPDSEITTIVTLISKKHQLPITTLLENFGEYISPALLKIYAASIKPNWKLLDLLEQTEMTMHKAVRFADKSATPPPLICKRITPNKISITYSSQRNMIDVGIGIIKGFARLYKEKVNIRKIEQNAGVSIVEVSLC